MSTITGLRIDVDGSERPFKCDREEMLQPLYSALCADLAECVPVGRTVEMWVDEEGLINGRQQPNPVGSALYLALGGQTPIMGPVVFLGSTDEEGWSTSLGDEEREQLSMLAAAPDPYLHLAFSM